MESYSWAKAQRLARAEAERFDAGKEAGDPIQSGRPLDCHLSSPIRRPPPPAQVLERLIEALDSAVDHLVVVSRGDYVAQSVPVQGVRAVD